MSFPTISGRGDPWTRGGRPTTVRWVLTLVQVMLFAAACSPPTREDLYVRDVLDVCRRYRESRQEATQTVTQVRLGDLDHREDALNWLKKHAAKLRVVLEQLQSLTPPPQYEPFHVRFVDWLQGQVGGLDRLQMSMRGAPLDKVKLNAEAFLSGQWLLWQDLLSEQRRILPELQLDRLLGQPSLPVPMPGQAEPPEV